MSPKMSYQLKYHSNQLIYFTRERYNINFITSKIVTYPTKSTKQFLVDNIVPFRCFTFLWCFIFFALEIIRLSIKIMKMTWNINMLKIILLTFSNRNYEYLNYEYLRPTVFHLWPTSVIYALVFASGINNTKGLYNKQLMTLNNHNAQIKQRYYYYNSFKRCCVFLCVLCFGLSPSRLFKSLSPSSKSWDKGKVIPILKDIFLYWFLTATFFVFQIQCYYCLLYTSPSPQASLHEST